MRYIFISDVHGQFDKMVIALEAVNFNKDKDTLVNLGDSFDRGEQSWEVLDFLMSCPHRILVWGNHDLRLKKLLLGEDWFQFYDHSNGVPATLKSFERHVFGKAQTQKDLDLRFSEIWNYCTQLRQYMRECVYALEFSDLIGTHAWLPSGDWRNLQLGTFSGDHNWYEATWSHTENEIAAENFPDKCLIAGHWHAWRLHAQFEEMTANPVLDPFIIPNKVIIIDGCSNATIGKVNTYIYESDETPILYGISTKEPQQRVWEKIN